MIFVAGCSFDKEQKGIPRIDIRKEYPEKEIILTDIADITYVHLDSKNDGYLYNGAIKYVTDNTIVVVDISSGSILFFSRDGKPKSRFNRLGQGPEEYWDRNFFVTFDEAADDVFVNAPGRMSLTGGHSILVYSSTGEYKRKLTLPTNSFPLVDFDDQSLFLYDMRNQYKKIFRKETDFSPTSYDSSYCRISKTDGKVLEYVQFPSNKIDLTDKGDGERSTEYYRRVVNCASGLFLCGLETDTIFLYGKDKILTPVICKTPLASDLDPKIILADFVDTGRYQFMITQILLSLSEESKVRREGRKLYEYYTCDKQTGEIFCPKISLPDYIGEEFFISANRTYFTGKEMLAHFELSLLELKQAYHENKLSGKLKELVATLNEDRDNNVYVFATFK